MATVRGFVFAVRILGGVVPGGWGPPMQQYQPLQYTIVVMDVAGSGGADDRQQLRMREDLRAVLADVLERMPFDPSVVYQQDQGDGMRLVVPAEVSPRFLLDPFVPCLAAALREHRTVVAAQRRLRVRLAVHLGLLHQDDVGWAGAPLVHSARLLDAVPVRRTLTANPDADVVLVISESMYDAVARHGYGLDVATYQQAQITVKETRCTAWIAVPGCTDPAWPDPDDTAAASVGGLDLTREAPRSGRPGAPDAGSVQHNVASHGGMVYAVQGGNQYVWHGAGARAPAEGQHDPARGNQPG